MIPQKIMAVPLQIFGFWGQKAAQNAGLWFVLKKRLFYDDEIVFWFLDENYPKGGFKFKSIWKLKVLTPF